MKNLGKITAIVVLVCATWTITSTQEIDLTDYAQKNRDDVPGYLKWRIEDIYPSIEEWEEDSKVYTQRLKTLEGLVDKCVNSSQDMLVFLDEMMETFARGQRLLAYAQCLNATHMSNPEYRQMDADAYQLISQASSSAQPAVDKILALGIARIEEYIKAEPSLQPYAHEYRDIFRSQSHEMPNEKASVARMFDFFDEAPRRLARILKEVDKMQAQITLSDGETHTLTYPTLVNITSSAEKIDQQAARKAYYENFSKYQHTYTGLLEMEVQNHIIGARLRNYASSLERQYFRDNIDPSIYTHMIAQVRKHLPLLHRYLETKRKAFGTPTLEYSQSLDPIVPEENRLYSYEEARMLCIKSSRIAGDEYASIMQKAFDEGWIDIVPHKDKRGFGGAFQVPGVHPYIMLAYTGTFTDLYYMVHDVGHGVHFSFIEKSQHFTNQQSHPLITEAAAMSAEQMLVDYMMKQADDDRLKLYILEKNLRGIFNAIYNQTLYAEFELKFHQHAEDGKSLTADWMNNTFLGLLREYYGHDQGVCLVDELNQYRWIDIDHFFLYYYLMNYSIGKIASLSLFDLVKNGGESGRQKFIEYLSAGGNDYSANILKNAGIDFSDDKTYERAFGQLEKLINELEVLVDKLSLQ